MPEKQIPISFRAGLAWFKRVVTRPRSELTLWQVRARRAIELGRHGLRQLRQDRAPQMAAALAFRSLFGLLPVLVVGTVIFRALGGMELFLEMAAELFTSLGMDQARIGADTVDGQGSQSLSNWLLGFVAEVEDINLAAITGVGLAVLIYSAMSLMVTIESSFNSIFRAPEGRPWLQRMTIYWTVLTLGPAATIASIYLARRLDAFVGALETWGPFLQALGYLWSFLVPWLVLAAIYKSLPNIHVGFRPALAGAFVSAVILLVGKQSLGAYMENALSVRQLYGSLGLIPLFMFWVYLMWLVVLFGLEVSAALQGLRGKNLDELGSPWKGSGVIEPAAVLTVMKVVADRFEQAGECTLERLQQATGIAGPVLAGMLERLVAAGFLHRLDRRGIVVSLGRPPERIVAAELLQVGFQMADEAGHHIDMPLLAELRSAQIELASSVNLASSSPRETQAS